MSSDIPGFYYDAVQQRYYRISPQSSNSVPSARTINDRARQQQLISKQLDSLQSHRHKQKKRLIKSRPSLLRQREYGQTSIQSYHNRILSNFIETLSPVCFFDNSSSFFLQDHTESYTNYDMIITSSGQCIQLINYQLYLTLLDNPTYSYELQVNLVDRNRSSYFLDSPSSFMSTTLLNDENHVIIRFLQFSSSPLTDHSLSMLSNNSSAPQYYYQENCQTIQLSTSTLASHTSPLMIKCSGPCSYSKSLDRFAFNINNYVYIYDLQTFQSICSIRVPIRRVTLSDMKFSYDNANVIYTTNGHQFQQWDIRQSNRICSTRIPILCSTIKCLQTRMNSILTSSFDERIHLIDLRMPTKPLLTYDSSSTSSPNNPHFSFAIDIDTEHFIAACSQYHIVNIWDLNSSRLLNRLRCPLPDRLVHTSTKCSIASVDKIPVIGIYHPEYCRITGMINRKPFS